jgi:hypothetical protein
MRMHTSLAVLTALLVPMGCVPSNSKTTSAEQDTDSEPPCEVCDGVDNDGDGIVDEGSPDTDGDGIADCVDEDTELCDGEDNDADGLVDEGWPDTDGDGVADCIDPEECDGVDNDGNGEVDEGFDVDANGVADCFDEQCNCADDDGDGLIDEGVDCSYAVKFDASADDVMEVYLNGTLAGAGSGWSNLFSQSYVLPSGVHHLAVSTRDTGGVVAGFNGRVTVPGAGATDYDTGSGAWLVATTDPGATYGMAWMTGAAAAAMAPDDAYVASSCASIWGYSPSGAPWVWADDCLRWDLHPKNYYYLEFDVCSDSASAEACDGEDNDGDGLVDEGWPDSDFDGVADCMEPELCDGFDNNGDGFVDEGWPDTDGDGDADCIDPEECDGLDNNGDGFVDEGFPDTDEDGIADCVDPETCDGLDNDGNGVVDEGFPDDDGDGIANCVDPELCDCIDNNGDGVVDEGIRTCLYDVTLQISADDYWEAYFDGAGWGGGSSWSTLGTLNATAPAGSHTIAVRAYDGFGLAAGMNARVEVTGSAVDAWDTGLGLWLVSATNPSVYGASTTWTTAPYSDMQPDSLYPASSGCLSRWGSGSRPSGGAWVWRANCAAPGTYPENWFLLEFDVCPESPFYSL